MSDIVTAKLYNGEVTVEFNPRAHRYKVIGIDAIPDGVTTICSAIVPKFLDDWAARVCLDYVRDRLQELDLVKIEEVLQCLDDAKDEHKRLRDAGGDRGTKAHDYIEGVLTSNVIPQPPDDPLVANTLKAFHSWKEDGMCEIMEVERIIYSKRLFYCGKTDVFGYVDGKPSILDFKTGSGFYDEHPYQLTGYAVALEEELDILIENGYVIHLDKKTGRYKVYPVEINDGLKDAWRLGVRHYKHLKKVRQMVKEIKNGMAEGYSARQLASAV